VWWGRDGLTAKRSALEDPLPPLSLFNALVSGAGAAAQVVREASGQFVQPSVRLGVTGLARSGKTVFATALVHHLTRGSALPALRASAEGRLRRVNLAPQPDDDVPRFPIEDHLAALLEERCWPESTNRISELRLLIDYERKAGWRTGPSTLALDIVDYPGEWLLDLALLDTDFSIWSAKTIERSRRADRLAMASEWHAKLAGVDPLASADESVVRDLSESFKSYLAALRAGPEAVATTPPGRFLMPGDLAGSPALTFAPLALPRDRSITANTLAALMQRRFEAYKTHVVRPFFREHFQRIDRQIVLVDVLAAVDAGPAALAELEEALDSVLLAFRTGRNNFVSRFFAPRADRVLFAATKADHVHHTQHERLEMLLRQLVARAVARTESQGARVGSIAIASVRATRETMIRDGLTQLRAVAGIPEAGERVGDEIFDGQAEAAIFPGELPESAEAVFRGEVPPGSLRFPRFRPPAVGVDAAGRIGRLPHIRLDRALEFLIGDHLA
jgi:predicted YcjX-like family ATPase